MEQKNAITQLERELIFVLKEEYSFYQSLYILLDKQRDMIRYDRDDHLLDLFAEIERCHRRIQKSEQKLEDLAQKHARVFRMAAVQPDVRKVARSIATLIRKNSDLVGECQEYMEGRYHRIRDELGELKSSRKMLKYISDNQPEFADGKN
jgi:hypothetical protein